jgi:ribosomal protein L37AE/L43A
MLIIHGAYHFWPKRVAFRNDYCLSCKAPRRSIAVRTFDVGHIFWVPILPVGFWRHWQCSVCGRKPHVARWSVRSLKWVALACLIGVSAIFWAVPEANTGSALIGWLFRLAAPAGAIVLLVHLLRSRGSSLRKRLAAIPAAAETTCPFCETPLVVGTGTRWSCPACGVVRY